MADLDVRATPARGSADLGDEFLPKPWPKFVGHWPRLAGRQEPDFWSGFEGDETDGDVAAALAAEFGARPMPWQWWAQRKICSRLPPDEDGIRLWTHPDCVLVCPRQNGKTEIALHRMLFGAVVLGETIIYSAQRWITAESVYNRLIEIIERSPALRARLAPRKGLPLGYSKQKDRGEIELKNGAVIRIGLRSKDMGVGLTKLDLVIFDEAYNLTAEQRTGLTGAQLAAENPQTIYLSTPPVWGSPKYLHCHVLASQRRLGRKRSPEMFFAEWMAPRPVPTGIERDDAAALRAARDHPDAARMGNPAHGVIHRARDMERERRAATTPDELRLFEADFLGWGIYPPDESERDPILPLERWRAMIDKTPTLVGERVIAIHRTADRRVWAVAAGCRTSAGKVHIEVGYLKEAMLPEVAVFLTVLIQLWNPAAILVDNRGRANVLTARMADLGYEVTELNTPQMAKAAGGFMDDALAGDLSHVDQKILEDALDVVQKRELPKKKDFVFNDDEAGVPQWTAAVMAHYGVRMFADEPVESASPATSSDLTDSAELDILEAAF